MTRISLVASTAVALCIALPAWAITPEEVWANWQAMGAGTGQEITATATARNGDTLELLGVSKTLTQPDGTTILTTMESVALTDMGDGSVEVTFSDSLPLTVTIPSGSGNADVIRVDIGLPGMTITASGTPEATSYDIDAPSLTATLAGIDQANGEEVTAAASATITDLVGSYLVTPGADGAMALESTGSIGSVKVDASASNPSSPSETFVLTAQIDGIETESSGNILGATMMADVNAALAAGFNIDSSTSVGAIRYDLNLTDSSGGGQFSGSFTGSEFGVALDAERLDYGFGVTGADIKAAGASMGIPPVATTFAELAFSVSMPVTKSDAPDDFAFLTRFVDFTLNDEIWGMVDPMGQLNREPATVILDLSGTGSWIVDILDPGLQNGTIQMPDMPGILNSLDLTELLLKGLGTQVAATGALTFDNTDTTTFAGLPAPTGKINVTLKGINALIDTLVSMGLVPEEEVMGVRMGMAMVMRPGAGPDELTSELEFKDKGFFANGQRLQ